MFRSAILLVVACGISWAMLSLALMAMLSVPNLTLLDKNSVRTQAIVTAISCLNHGSVVVGFDVDGTHFTGSARAVDCERARLNDSVTVWYLPSKPEINSDSEPHQQLKEALLFSILAPPGAGAVLGLFALMRSMIAKAFR